MCNRREEKESDKHYIVDAFSRKCKRFDLYIEKSYCEYVCRNYVGGECCFGKYFAQKLKE